MKVKDYVWWNTTCAVSRVQDDAARAGAASHLEDAEVAHSELAVSVAQPCSQLQSRQAVPCNHADAQPETQVQANMIPCKVCI